MSHHFYLSTSSEEKRVFFPRNSMKTLSYLWYVTLTFFMLISSNIQAAPASEVIDFWVASNDKNAQSIDHRIWQEILESYVIDNHESGVNRVNYAELKKNDLPKLSSYISAMQAIDPRTYSKVEQKAYWINLYNALTVKLIVDHYPVKSITKIGKSLFKFGPWDDDIIRIQNQALTLNDIEHGILRPIWQDNRIHYAVNCASIGCPNLSATAFTAENTENLLESAAKDFVNHPRGVMVKGDDLLVSSIFHWYIDDFGGQDKTLIEHLQHYAKAPLKESLKGFKGDIDHDYDWNLNEL